MPAALLKQRTRSTGEFYREGYKNSAIKKFAEL
jgi:hypothetical protein